MPTTRRNQLLHAALDYLARGIPVLPLHHPVNDRRPQGGLACSCHVSDCASPAKHPLADLVPHGVTDATLEPSTITRWWARHPDANVGLATGHVFDVLDVDGPDGAAAIREFATALQLRGTGPLVRTGSGGWHYLVAPTGLGNPSPRGLEHVDWRGQGGYVVAPPSRHAGGARYRFVRGLDRALPQVPEPLRQRLLAVPLAPSRRTTGQGRGPALNAPHGQLGHPYGQAALEAECAQLAGTAPGGRNQRLYLAGLRLHSLVAGGVLDAAEVDQRLIDAAALTGLAPLEIERTVASARRIAAQHPRDVPEALPVGGRRRPRPPSEPGRQRTGLDRGRRR